MSYKRLSKIIDPFIFFYKKDNILWAKKLSYKI